VWSGIQRDYKLPVRAPDQNESECEPPKRDGIPMLRTNKLHFRKRRPFLGVVYVLLTPMPIVLAAAVLIGALIVATDLSPAIEPAPGGVVLITVVIGILKVTLIVAAPLSCAWLWKASRRCFLAEPRLTLATDSRRPICICAPSEQMLRAVFESPIRVHAK